jgi:hypothetical protein
MAAVFGSGAEIVAGGGGTKRKRDPNEADPAPTGAIAGILFDHPFLPTNIINIIA